MTETYFEILRAGTNSSIQDQGRKNLYHIGITISGAMDQKIFKVSNALEGNVSENEIKNIDWRGNQEVGWFISDFVLTIGMIGTVSGFLLMLTGAFAGIDLTDEVAMKNVLEKMSKGMSTALYTTLFGLICGGLLKIQYFSLGRATDLLIGPIDNKS